MSSETILPPAPAAAAAEIVVEGKVERVPLSKQYKLGLLLVTVGMMLLPVIYLLLTGLVVFGVYFFSVTNSKLAESDYFHDKVLFFVPLASGCALVLFMLKPLFTRTNSPEAPFELKKSDAPEFHRYVASIADSIGVRKPRRILIDMNANAAAYLRRTPYALFSRPTLVIGMPLILTLDARQMSGVIAHEICHLSQSGAMYLTLIIHRINYWLTNAVYGPHFVEELVNWSQEIGPLYAIFGLTKLFVRATRWILYWLLVAGHSMACFMLRQMEFEADGVEAGVAGSGAFDSIFDHLDHSAAALQFMNMDLDFAFRSERMPADVAPLLLANIDLVKRSGICEMPRVELGGYHRYMETHPPREERTAAVMREPKPGLVQTELPVPRLFPDFSKFSRNVTAAWYQQHSGQQIKSSDTAQTLIAEFGKDPETFAVYERFYPVPFSRLRPWAFKYVPAPAAEELESVRQVLKTARDACRRQPAGENLERLVAQRITLALQLIKAPEIQQKTNFPDDEINRISSTLLVLTSISSELDDLKKEYAALSARVSEGSKQLRLKKVEKSMRADFERLRPKLLNVQRALGKTPFPFACVENLTIRQYAIPDVPDEYDFSMMGCNDVLLWRIQPLYFQVLCKSLLMTEAVEKMLD